MKYMENGHNKTMYACFTGYVVQTIVNNFAPLLFLTFQGSYGIPSSKITMLVTTNFILQLPVDLVPIGFVDRIGHRASMMLTHVFVAAGLVSLTVLSEVFEDPFTGLPIAVVVYAVGGGLLEALVSPVMGTCPTDNKEKAMSLFHSFYCQGHVGVVLCSTIYFRIFGIGGWKAMALIWAVIPLLNTFAFAKVPIVLLTPKNETGLTIKALFSKRIFQILMLVMVCAGTCEQSISQWASTFVEKGLGVSKTVEDLVGPMAFAVLMGTSRALYGRLGRKINLERFMIYNGILCILFHLCISLLQVPVLGLAGCALCGLSAGILWPAAFSMAAASVKRGGTAMFAFLALAGDLGCSEGPILVGVMSGYFGDDLRKGILAVVVFPVLLLLGITGGRKSKTGLTVQGLFLSEQDCSQDSGSP